MGPLKAPGPNAFQTVFFQRKTWDVVGPLTISFVQRILEEGGLPTSLVEDFFSVDFENGEDQSYNTICPISLCNVFYKLDNQGDGQ